MTYKHKPMSQILAPASATAEDKGEAKLAPKEEPKGTELPEKYRGKTAAEIADMHMNAEQELGRVRNEVGSMRGLISDLSAIQRPAAVQAVHVQHESGRVSEFARRREFVGRTGRLHA